MQDYDGSTSHPDPARETFCQEMVAGESLYGAYETAGFKRPRGNANRMRREPEVSARIAWLANKVASFDEALIGYRRLEHRRALEHIATADRLSLFEDKTVSRIVGHTKDGKPKRRRYRQIGIKPLAKLTEAERALIDGLEISDKGAVKVLIPKRLDARAMLAKLDGLDKPTKVSPTNADGSGPAIYEVTWKDSAAQPADAL